MAIIKHEEIRENSGGVISFFPALVAQISSFPRVINNGYYSGSIGFSGSYDWEDNYNLLNKASFEEYSDDTDAGTIYTSTLQFEYAKYDATMIEKINYLMNNLFIVKVFLANGNYIVMGDPGRPVKISQKTQSGKKVSDYNHAILTIEHTSPYPCPSVSS